MHIPLPHRSVIVAVLLIGSGSPAVSHSLQVVSPNHESHRDAELDAALSRRAQSILDRVELLEGQLPGTRVSASYDYGSGHLRMDFDKAFLPENYGGAFEDQRDSVTLAAIVVAETIGPVTLVEHHYGGQPAEHYFPEIAEEDAAGRAGLGEVKQSMRGHALVSAAHGYYYHHGQRQWILQRDTYNGVTEDLITPGYADELQLHLAQRSSVASTRPRSQLAEVPHPESMQTWWKMAARYSIEQLLPGNPEVWNSKGDRIYGLRDYDDDINSRPLLANHVGADVAFHLHTNGEDTALASGVRVVVQPGRPVDSALGVNVLCYMKELIQATEAYEAFPVSATPMPSNKGENRIAKMPSVLVEMGFHTNPVDAAALQDPVFRTASMKGVEKGYRLFREGKDCQPLAADPVESIRLPQGQEQKVDVPFKGYPQYPIELITTNVGCPPGWTCTDGKVHIEAEGAKPSRVTMRCDNGRSGPTFWETRVVDADGVKSPAVRHSVQCIRNSRGADGLVDPIGTITAVSS